MRTALPLPGSAIWLVIGGFQQSRHRAGIDRRLDAGREAGAQSGVTNMGESYGDTFDAFMAKDITVARTEGVDKAFASLMSGTADYMTIGLYPGRDEARISETGDDQPHLPPARRVAASLGYGAGV